MKNYKDLVNELPSKTVVFSFGRFNPPTIGHELLIKVVRKLASQRKADHVVFASATQDAKKNPLEVSKKVQYLELLFPNTRFVGCSPQVRTFLEAAKSLNKRYRNLVMVAGSDRVQEFEKLLKQYNGKEYKFDTIEVISAGTRDPDADDASGMSGTKMRSLASKGDYLQFKRGLPTTVRDIDGKRLMNDIRCGMGFEVIKEQINLVKDDIREQYFRGELFKEGDIVESDNTVYKIIKRGSNHLLLQDEAGLKKSKWIQDVQLTEREYMLDEKLITEGESEDNINHAAARGAKSAQDARKMLEIKAKQAKQIEDIKSRQAREVQSARNNMTAANEDKKYDVPKSLMSLNDFRKTLKMGAKPVTDAGEQDVKVDLVHNGVVGDTHLGTEHGIRRMRIKHHLGEASYNHDDNRTGFSKRSAAWHADGGANDEGHPPEKFKPRSTMDRPHTVHIGGKPWKKFSNGHQAHAAARTLQAKGKDAHAIAHFGEETEVCPTCNKNPCWCDDSHGFVSEETTEQQGGRKEQLKRFKQQAADAKLGTGISEATYKGLEAEDKPGKIKTAVVKTHPKAVEIETVEGWKDEKKPVKEGTEEQLEFDFEEINESEFDALIESLTEDEILEAYEDSELAIVDEETGEELEAVAEEAEFDTPALMEVLSRIERVRAKARMRRTKAKRERAEKIALRHFSSTPVANRRARRLSVSVLKKRMMKGVNPSKASIGQKEAMERYIAQHKKVVDRLSARMVTKVRQIEKARMSHKKFTKGVTI